MHPARGSPLDLMSHTAARSSSCIWATIAHSPVTSLQHAEWTPVFDYNPAQAINSRKGILDRVATDRIMAIGYHFPFLAIGHVVRHDTGPRNGQR